MEKIFYLVVRYELGDTGVEDFPQTLQNINEKAFEKEADAISYTSSLDPTGEGLEYICPCGCGDVHWRSWEVETIIVDIKQ